MGGDQAKDANDHMIFPFHCICVVSARVSVWVYNLCTTCVQLRKLQASHMSHLPATYNSLYSRNKERSSRKDSGSLDREERRDASRPELVVFVLGESGDDESSDRGWIALK
jgi:hypothetical protein